MAEKKTASQATELSFESELDAVHGIVEKMESGELGLQESLAAFEKGISGLRRCEKLLSETETRVKILLGEEELDFDATRTDDTELA